MAEAAARIVAIACNPGRIGNYGIAAARQSIEKRRFADVRPPHDDYDRDHPAIIAG
jgi:hypothetical protein